MSCGGATVAGSLTVRLVLAARHLLLSSCKTDVVQNLLWLSRISGAVLFNFELRTVIKDQKRSVALI